MSDTPYADLAAFAALPRIIGLSLSCDGQRLVAVVQQPDSKSARYSSALWQIPLDGTTPRRLTHSDKGESSPAFRPDGSLLFLSSRPDPGRTANDDTGAALCCLPESGEAYVLARRAGGLGGPVVARAAGTTLVTGSRLMYSDDENDADRRTTRADRKVSAILHTGWPIRYWDHELGAESTRLLVEDGGELRDLAPDIVHELTNTSYSISADGATLALSLEPRRPRAQHPAEVAVIDVATGKRTEVIGRDGWDFLHPVISPDGSMIALAQEREGAFDRPITTHLAFVPTAGGDPVLVDLGDLYPSEWIWAPDSTSLYVAGDLHGRGAVLAVDASTASVTHRLVADAAYTSLCISPDGATLYALRSLIDAAPAPVRLVTSASDQEPRYLPTPAPTPSLPGRLVEISVPAADGAEVHGWLCLPEPTDTPAPVMLWIHGGPFGSYNAWSWRWNPWVAVARGWAVVMPDPAHSTGYGQAWIDRAWPYVAADVYADCEAVLDSVLERPDVDGGKLACLGASFGGYMTNWVAGHVDRFGAIVTHSGSYALDQQHKTTDSADYKTGLFGEPAEHPDWYAQNSPHNGSVGATPMLVIHGNRDYRVPYSESLRLFWDLVSGWDGQPETMPHRFLQLTDQNHWILAPADVEVWYDAVLGFCAQHVLGAQWIPSVLL